MADLGVKVSGKVKVPEPPTISVAPEIEVALRSLCVCGQKLARMRTADPKAPACCLRILVHNEPTTLCQKGIPGDKIKWVPDEVTPVEG
jgi:hypothetical protein